MILPYLGLFVTSALALPYESANKEKLTAALANFGNDNFTWPQLYLAPVAEEGHQDVKQVIEESQSPVVADQDVEAVESEEEDVPLEPYEDEVPVDFPAEPAVALEPKNEGQTLVLRHPANDNPVDPDRDAFHFKVADPTRPICTFFQHSVLGADFGEDTFPRVSYVSSEVLPYRVHYAPDDELRYESYRWPFAACNQGCELQALKIRAMFDWELNPDNQESALDKETKEVLLLAREICEWKNAHYHFAIREFSDPPALRFRRLARAIAPRNGIQPTPTGNGTQDLPTKIPRVGGQLLISGEAQAAMNEIENIFRANKGPQDIAAMFRTVIRACQVHRYTSIPMAELSISSPGDMVQQAMSQIGRVFAETAGQIPVWETRDAIVRATQIYRYQEEGGA